MAAGSNLALYVKVGYYAAASALSTVSWNSSTTGWVRVAQSALSAAGDRAELWRLLNPTTGTHTVALTFSASTDGNAGSQSMSGVDQTTPEGTAAPATGNSGTLSCAPAGGVTGDMAIDATAADNAGGTSLTMTAHTGRVQEFNAGVSGLEIASGSRMPDPADPQTMDWSLSPSKAWAMAGIIVKQSSGTAVIPPGLGPAQHQQPTQTMPIGW